MTVQKSGIMLGEGAIALGEMPVPTAGPDDILIAVAACGICGSDMHILKEEMLPAGTVIGHEFSGRIVFSGANVKDLPVGTRVVANPVRCGLGLGVLPGAFAQYVLVTNAVRGDTVFVLPDSVTDLEGALVEPFSVGLHAVNISGARPGDKAVIFGAGTIGLCVLASLRAAGVTDIVILDVSAKRLALALQMGATAALNPMDGDVQEMLGAHFGRHDCKVVGRMTGNADIAFECAGVPRAFSDALESLRLGGKIVMMAVYGSKLTFNPLDMLQRELTMFNSHAYAHEFADAIALIEKGVDLTPLVTHRFPLDAVTAAFAAQANTAEAVKVVVEMA